MYNWPGEKRLEVGNRKGPNYCLGGYSLFFRMARPEGSSVVVYWSKDFAIARLGWKSVLVPDSHTSHTSHMAFDGNESTTTPQSPHSLPSRPSTHPIMRRKNYIRRPIWGTNIESCPTQVTWKVKFKCQFCLSRLFLSCPVFSSVGQGGQLVRLV